MAIADSGTERPYGPLELTKRPYSASYERLRSGHWFTKSKPRMNSPQCDLRGCGLGHQGWDFTGVRIAPYSVLMIEYLNQNGGAVTALATIALLGVTGWYAWITRALLLEAQRTRLDANEPRVVAYLRPHEVHSNFVQLCIANLSGAAAVEVAAWIKRVTEWPASLDLENSKTLSDLGFLRPHEVLKFDLGRGPDLFCDGTAAVFQAGITYQSLDGRIYSFQSDLKVESLSGYGSWRIYGIDDVARRLDEISKTLKGFAGFGRMKVDTYNSADRADEATWRDQQREAIRNRDGRNTDT